MFESIDTDKSGKIGFDELFEFVRGHRHSLDHRTKHGFQGLQLPPGADFTLNEIAWDLETLRILMQQMLIRFHGASRRDSAWDDSGDFQLDKREFVQNMRKFLDDQHADLWDSEVQPIVEQAFGAIQEVTIVGADGKRRDAGGNSHNERVRVSGIAKNRFAGDANQLRIDIIEFERWLDAPTQRPEHLKVVPKSRKLLRRQTTRRLELEKPKAPKRSPTKERMEQRSASCQDSGSEGEGGEEDTEEQTRRLNTCSVGRCPMPQPPRSALRQDVVTSRPSARPPHTAVHRAGIKLGAGGETNHLAATYLSSRRRPRRAHECRRHQQAGTLTVTTSPHAFEDSGLLHSGASYPSPKSVGLSPKALTGWSPRLPRQTLGPHGFTFLSEATEAQYAETPLISFLSDDEARCLRLAFLCSMAAVKAECFPVRLPRRFWLVSSVICVQAASGGRRLRCRIPISAMAYESDMYVDHAPTLYSCSLRCMIEAPHSFVRVLPDTQTSYQVRYAGLSNPRSELQTVKYTNGSYYNNLDYCNNWSFY